MRDYDSTVKNLREAAKGLLFDAMPYRASVMRDAADAIEELLDELTTIRKQLPHWISVEERLPEFVMNNSGCVCTTKLLFRTEHKTIHIGYAIRTYHNIETVEGYECIVVDRWYDQSGDMIEDVTHWMPLPTPPKGVE